MAICTECEREYLDSYEVCPFCAKRWREEEEALLPAMRPEKSRRINPTIAAIFGGAASLTGIIVYVFLQFSFGSMVVETAGTAGAPEVCFVNQSLVERAVVVRFTETQEPVKSLDPLFPDYVQTYPVCPEEGKYTYTWDPAIPRLSCSVHGWHGE